MAIQGLAERLAGLVSAPPSIMLAEAVGVLPVAIPLVRSASCRRIASGNFQRPIFHASELPVANQAAAARFIRTESNASASAVSTASRPPAFRSLISTTADVVRSL